MWKLVVGHESLSGALARVGPNIPGQAAAGVLHFMGEVAFEGFRRCVEDDPTYDLLTTGYGEVYHDIFRQDNSGIRAFTSSRPKDETSDAFYRDAELSFAFSFTMEGEEDQYFLEDTTVTFVRLIYCPETRIDKEGEAQREVKRICEEFPPRVQRRRDSGRKSWESSGGNSLSWRVHTAHSC